jgi:hypothetical protein
MLPLRAAGPLRRRPARSILPQRVAETLDGPTSNIYPPTTTATTGVSALAQAVTQVVVVVVLAVVVLVVVVVVCV